MVVREVNLRHTSDDISSVHNLVSHVRDDDL